MNWQYLTTKLRDTTLENRVY